MTKQTRQTRWDVEPGLSLIRKAIYFYRIRGVSVYKIKRTLGVSAQTLHRYVKESHDPTSKFYLAEETATEREGGKIRAAIDKYGLYSKESFSAAAAAAAAAEKEKRTHQSRWMVEPGLSVIRKAIHLYRNGHSTVTKIQRTLGVSARTLYRYVEKSQDPTNIRFYLPEPATERKKQQQEQQQEQPKPKPQQQQQQEQQQEQPQHPQQQPQQTQPKRKKQQQEQPLQTQPKHKKQQQAQQPQQQARQQQKVIFFLFVKDLNWDALCKMYTRVCISTLPCLRRSTTVLVHLPNPSLGQQITTQHVLKMNVSRAFAKPVELFLWKSFYGGRFAMDDIVLDIGKEEFCIRLVKKIKSCLSLGGLHNGKSLFVDMR